MQIFLSILMQLGWDFYLLRSEYDMLDVKSKGYWMVVIVGSSIVGVFIDTSSPMWHVVFILYKRHYQ